MRILVLSDTHVPVAAKNLPPIIEEEARRCDVCLHAGDMISYDIYNRLSELVQTYAVCGNMDDQTVIDKLPNKKIIKFEDITLALAHGRGAPDAVISSLDKIFEKEYNSIDIFVFGHSHIATDVEIKGKIYFNPGSPTDTMFAPKRTYGILEIHGKKIVRKVVSIG